MTRISDRAREEVCGTGPTWLESAPAVDCNEVDDESVLELGSRGSYTRMRELKYENGR